MRKKFGKFLNIKKKLIKNQICATKKISKKKLKEIGTL